MLAESLGRTFRGATIHAEGNPAVAAEILTERGVGLFVVAVRGFDLDAITLLGVWAEHQSHCVPALVVTPDIDSTAMLALRALPIPGIFDSSCGDIREFEDACATVACGLPYRSRTARAVMAAKAVIRNEGKPGHLTVVQPTHVPPKNPSSGRKPRRRG